jgi:hypothetical protein
MRKIVCILLVYILYCAFKCKKKYMLYLILKSGIVSMRVNGVRVLKLDQQVGVMDVTHI